MIVEKEHSKIENQHSIISKELINSKSAHDQESHIHSGANIEEICVVLRYHLELPNNLVTDLILLCQVSEDIG